MATNNNLLSGAGSPSADAISTNLASVAEQAASESARDTAASDAKYLRGLAHQAVSKWKPCPPAESSKAFRVKWKSANRSIRQASREQINAGGAKPEPGTRWLVEASSLLYQTLVEVDAALQSAAKIPQIISPTAQKLPRLYAAAESYFQGVCWRVEQRTLLTFLDAIQESSPFTDAELSLLPPIFELAVLEQIATRATIRVDSPMAHTTVSATPSKSDSEHLTRCLRNLKALDWKDVFEALSMTERILRQDPAGTYPLMDTESRSQYRSSIAALAARTSWSESEIAQQAVKLAHEPQDTGNERANQRRSHVGYFLIDAGQRVLKQVIGYNAPLAERIREAIRERPAFFYLTTIALATSGIFIALKHWLAISRPAAWDALLVALLVIPAIECAVAVTNLLVTHMFGPKRFPRLDFAKGIPAECATLVAIPILLTDEEQVRQAVRDLEIRYLANRDRNLHFALVTDPPDSLQQIDERDALAGICSKLIRELNEKYSCWGAGSFVHLHRHRTHNVVEGIWMGWERKRGKILDLNNLLLDKDDHFPVKAGNLEVLRQIRYVIALDQDTQLPTELARKLIGALAHPLNQAVVDPVTNRVVEGYAILQPRVAISIKAKNRSRLAAIWSGDTGFDLYTQAVSDVYQDLFGAGIYTGKGIYEVETFQTLLEHRFPCNAILSHDFIEGSHARAGLISDLEVVDDYPSHISAFSRRRHRWVRGDWQIILWLFPRVPESFGKLVPNPLPLIARWQIVDNLRRSLSEVAILALLLCSWLVLPGIAVIGTLAAVALLTFPIYLEFFLSLLGAGRRIFSAAFWRNTASDLGRKHLHLLCRIILLCHQSLVALDAVARTIVRMAITHKRLLEWETAAQAERKTRPKTPVETYLDWTPIAAIAISGIIACFRPSSLLVALPFLMLWGTSKAVSDWLAQPSPRLGKQLNSDDRGALRQMALRTWRFFTQFSTEQDNWLIPDVVQASPPIIVHSISTTNLGLLFNAQLAALDLGFLTLPEFVSVTARTLEAADRLPKLDGHFYNWYDTRTLAPQYPRFISTVDNGNLICCLWTLKEACLELKHEPLFHGTLWHGISTHVETIEVLLGGVADRTTVASLRSLRRRIDQLAYPTYGWRKNLSEVRTRILAVERRLCGVGFGDDVECWAHALADRIKHLEATVLDFAPWLLPEFAAMCESSSLDLPDMADLTLESLEPVLTKLLLQLQSNLEHESDGTDPTADRLREALSNSLAISRGILERLNLLASSAERLANAANFSFLYNPRKKLLSIGYDAEKGHLHDACYDLLASEARSAVFVAIAKGDIPQETWTRLGRSRIQVKERCVLLSWTGTMFEYLMPALWMRSYPNTLLEQTARAAVFVQRAHAEAERIPWGISECSFAEHGPDGRYGYRAFGVPELALSRLEPDDLVVSPYSSFLALVVDAVGAVANLRDMKERGWLGAYGFYEACDFTPSRIKDGDACEPVVCWMAHHQGMSLTAAANALCNSSMQRRFHAEPMVAATERLLHETARGMTAVDPNEKSELDWLMTSVPVLRNVWQVALSAPSEGLETPSANQAHNGD